MKKRLLLLIPAVFLLLVAIEYFFLRHWQKKEKPLSFPQAQITPGFQILRHKKNDQEGRTIVFEHQSEIRPYTSSGIFYLEGTNVVRCAIGSFLGWEEIPESEDRYILLTDPQTNQDLPKFRILFRPFIGDQGQEADKMTMIQVLDLNKMDQPLELSISDYHFIGELSTNTIKKIFNENDIVTVRPYFQSQTDVFKDSAGIPLARVVILRRFGGVDNL